MSIHSTYDEIQLILDVISIVVSHIFELFCYLHIYEIYFGICSNRQIMIQQYKTYIFNNYIEQVMILQLLLLITNMKQFI